MKFNQVARLFLAALAAGSLPCSSAQTLCPPVAGNFPPLQAGDDEQVLRCKGCFYQGEFAAQSAGFSLEEDCQTVGVQLDRTKPCNGNLRPGSKCIQTASPSKKNGASRGRELNPIETVGSGTCNEQMGCNDGFLATCVHSGTEYVTSCSSGSSLSVIGEPVRGSVDTSLAACGPCECYADSLSPISAQPGSGAGGAGNLNVTDCPAVTSASCSSCAGEVVFRFSTLEAKWETHDSIAKLMGCELASIHSAEEQALAEAEIARFQGFAYANTGAWENSFVYIGGKVVVSESDPATGNYTYEWSDGSGTINVIVNSITAGAFANFKPNDPNANSDGSGGFNEEYLAMSLDENFSSGITLGEWVDFSNMLSPALYKCCAPASPPPPGDDCSVSSRIFQPDVPDSLSELYQASTVASSSCLASCPEAPVYYFSAFETQWETHDAIAKSLGCELATIVTADQQSVVEAELALYPSLPYANQGPWENSFAFFGGKQIPALSDPQAGSYAFEWSDGSGNITGQRDGTTSDYTNFKGGDPNGDTSFGPESYLALSLEESFSGDIPLGQWVDFSNMMSPAIYMCCGAKRDYVGCLAGDEAATPTVSPAVPTDEPTFLPPSSLPTTPPTETLAPGGCEACSGGNAVFRFSTLEAKWETHNNIAKLLGCELASIKGIEEQIRAEEEILRFRSFNYQNTGAWENSFVYIGGKVVPEESDPGSGNYTFEWSDGSGKIHILRNGLTPSFSNFKSDDPNGADDGSGGFNEEFLALSLDENFSSGIALGEWVDFSNMLSPALYKCCAPAPPAEPDCSVSSRIFLPDVPDSLADLSQGNGIGSTSNPCTSTCLEAPTFYFSSFEGKWENHDSIAKTLGCELASILDGTEQSLAEAELALYPNLPYNNQGSWETSFVFIGGQVVSASTESMAGSYAFEWSDGSGTIVAQRDGTTSNYTNFKGGDPNGNTFFGPEPYLALSLEESFSGDIPLGQWVDFSNMMSPALYKCCGAKRDFSLCLVGSAPSANSPRPSSSPTLLPSPVPSKSQSTITPSASPSQLPSNSPIFSPSKAPSSSPRCSPSVVPWSQVTKLTAEDGAAGDQYANSVAIWNETAIIGADWDDDTGTNSGSAYIFEKVGDSWDQVAKLTAADGAASDGFGKSVAISDETVIIGAWQDDDKGTNSGSVYIFEKAGNSWTQVGRFIADDGAEYDYFGYSVAISGDTAIVGAIWDDDNGGYSGSAYIFEKADSSWTNPVVSKLTAGDGAERNNFGISVAISGGTAIVGAVGDDDNGVSSGSAYIFEKNNGSWHQVAKLTVDDGAQSDFFGNSVAISGITAIVGAYLDDDVDKGTDSGSAYIFEKGDRSWGLVAKLTADDGAAGDNFGSSVAISGETAIVGADRDNDKGTSSGSAYIYKKVDCSWIQIAKLTGDDAAAGDLFGKSVAISEDATIVGAWWDDGVDNGTTNSGSAYIFETPKWCHSNTPSVSPSEEPSSSPSVSASEVPWSQVAKLTTGNNGAAFGSFGFSVAISGDTAIVGVDWDDEKGIYSGSAYIIEKFGNSWDQVAKLTAADGAAFDYFGRSVAISGDTAIIGAFGDDDRGIDSGSVYIYEKVDGSWTNPVVKKLINDAGAAYDRFGYSVAISGDTAIVGTYGNGSLSGSAYIYKKVKDAWSRTPTKLTVDDGAARDFFGSSVAIWGDTAIVGAYIGFDSDVRSGSAYIFEKFGNSWYQVAKLTAGDGAAFDDFGRSVAISGDTAIIGAFGDDDRGIDSGSAYIYEKVEGAWNPVPTKLIAKDGAARDFFGYSVGISGDTAIVGAYGDGSFSGSAYIYKKANGAWNRVPPKLIAKDGAADDRFGWSVAISGDSAIVGAYKDDDVDNDTTDSGSAYIFKKTRK